MERIASFRVKDGYRYEETRRRTPRGAVAADFRRRVAPAWGRQSMSDFGAAQDDAA